MHEDRGGRMRCCAWLMLASVACATLLRAQRDPTGGIGTGLASIHGRLQVLDDPKQALEHIPVQLSQSNGTPIATAYTSGNGQFLFNNVATGGYEITVNAPGFERHTEKIMVQTASGRIQVQIHLRRSELSPSIAAAPQAVSALDMQASPAARREREKGLEKLRKGDLPGAERQFRKALSLHAAYPQAWVDLGNVQARRSPPDDALKSFREALRHDPRHREALLATARLLNDRGRHLEALGAAAEFEQIDSRDPRNHLEIARGLLGAGKIDEAEAAARQLEGEPHSQLPEVHLVLLSISQTRGDKPRAASELRTYLKEMADSGVPATTPAIARARELLARLETELAASK